MDKSAQAVPAWETLGFGFVELGTVTWHPQPGNPQPRVFRAVAEQALVNRMGFNNPGAAALGDALRQWRTAGCWPHHPVGINLGKSRITPLDQAAADYANSFRELRDLADFFVVNVSSPNTPGLRQLQEKSALDEIFAALQEVNQPLAATRDDTGHHASPPSPPPAAQAPNAPKPILVKIAPDLSWEALDEILDVTAARRLAGVVATNTTLERPVTSHPDCQRVFQEAGGLSGRPLRNRSTEIIRHLYRQTKGQLPIVGVGGIFNAADAWEKIVAGASLVQVYTGLVYEGPAVLKSIVRGLAQFLSQRGQSRLEEAVGLGDLADPSIQPPQTLSNRSSSLRFP
jgi:dihydroorotate dehydrogenase